MRDAAAMTKQASWSVRLYEEGDGNSLNRLYNEVFGKERELEEWKWKFQDNAATHRKIISVGIINDRIVGMYPSVLSKWKIGTRLGLVAQPVETAIAENARDGRLIIALRGAFVSKCIALGVSFAFGVPNESHYQVGKRLLDYRDVVQMSILHKRLNLRLPYHLGPPQPALSWVHHVMYTWSSKTRHRTRAGDVTTLTVNHFDERFDRLWRHASKAYQILAIRDRHFLEWRYHQNPQKRHACIAAMRHDELVGYLILQFATAHSARVGIIADVFSLPDEAVVDTLLHSAILFCLKEGIDYVRCGALAHTELYRALRRAGFTVKRRGRTVVYKPFDGLSEQICQDSTQWYLTLGDFDFDE